MHKQIIISSAEWIEDRLIFSTEYTDFILDEWKPHEHMLVDSNHLTFLYMLESKEDYCYVTIPHTYWKFCKALMVRQKKAYIRFDGKELELKKMKEELQYLVQNIEGNANYGETLVKTVEEIFL